MRGSAGVSCAILLAILWVTAPARATQFFYESFNYAVGSNLKDQPGWAEPGGPNDTALDKIILPNLTLPGVSDVGHSLQTAGKFSFDSFIGADDNDPNSFIGGDGNTFWFSFILKRTVAGNGGVTNPDYGGLLLGANPDASKNLFIGKPGGGASTKYVLESEDGTNQGASNVTEVLGTQGYLVAKITFHDATPDDVSLYVNPSTLAPEGSLVADASLQIALAPFNDFFISTGTSATWVVDELKMGTTFVDVAPEPASVGTLVIAAGALLRRRQRQA
jgi:hypothetical protein